MSTKTPDTRESTDLSTDGGVIDGESGILEAGDGGRPDECSCWDAGAALPCFECYAAGFGDPNPAEPANDDGPDA